MARKVFLSFLGAYPYEELNYIFNNDSYKSKFAPAASIKVLTQFEFCPDVFYIFVTEEARKNNLELLKEELKSCNFNLNNLIPVDIDNETNSEKLWNNFEKVYSVLGKEDSIVFDITYGFRATPMLLTTLLNYAKVLKEIKVFKIFYGAYEKGRDTAPIWDLTDFSTIQDLAIATDEFINFNIPYNFTAFFDESLKEKIKKFSSQFSTNRSLEIYSGEIASELHTELDMVLSSKPNAFNEIRIILNEKLSKFKNNQIRENGFHAVEFCINSDLIQQAITILQELIITIIALDINEDYKIEGIRNIISAALNKKDKDTFDKHIVNTKALDGEQIDEIVNKIYSLVYKEKLTSVNIKFSMSVRNDINHAGLRDNPRDSLTFKDKVKAYYLQFQNIFLINK